MIMRTTTYGPVAKIFHWAIVALLAIQYPIGWLMPDIHRGTQPGLMMNLHVSFGLTILVLIVLRFAWRLTHPVAPQSSLTGFQRVSSEGLHWVLYLSVLATTVTGWMFASFRGWTLSYFGLWPFPMLSSANSANIRFIDGWHQAAEWALLIAIGLHIGAALLHIFVYRDRLMQRMLPD
jgi:cytochrome b561